MGRKAFAKVKLTEDEIDFVALMVDTTRCNWFELAGSWIDEDTGKRLHFKSDDYDCVWDTEMGHFVSLQFGLKNLMEAFDLPEHIDKLTTDEKKIWNHLCEIVFAAYGKKFYADPLTDKSQL